MTKTKLAVLVGAGSSVELGVPAMHGMALDFLQYSKENKLYPDLVERCMGSPIDLETLLDNVDSILRAEPALAAARERDVSDMQQFRRIRAELEWFVQHSAERVAAADSYAMWGSLLRSIACNQHISAVIVTTNYDRAIEMAAQRVGTALDDGFASSGDEESVAWGGLQPPWTMTQLLKLHGSTDWYEDSQGPPRKLRHPMPLFGRSTLKLSENTILERGMVLPAREKLTTHLPFSRLLPQWVRCSAECDVLIVCGSSMRDRHVRDCVVETASRVPVFYVDLFRPPPVQVTARWIKQTASQFLVSTFPSALLASDMCESLSHFSASSGESESAVTIGVLPALRTMVDESASSYNRCRAIEALVQSHIALDYECVSQLLTCNDIAVARYALGLALTSPHAERLKQFAERCPHAANGAFLEDLSILTRMMEGSP